MNSSLAATIDTLVRTEKIGGGGGGGGGAQALITKNIAVRGGKVGS